VKFLPRLPPFKGHLPFNEKCHLFSVSQFWGALHPLIPDPSVAAATEEGVE